jgi:hypothetical protein
MGAPQQKLSRSALRFIGVYSAAPVALERTALGAPGLATLSVAPDEALESAICREGRRDQM